MTIINAKAAKLAANFRHQAGGSVAIIFALSAFILVGIVGSAVDYARAQSVKAKVYAAADAAALDAVKVGTDQLLAGSSSWQVTAQTSGMDFFTTQVAQLNFASPPSPVVTVSNANAAVTATVGFSTAVPTVFMRLLQIPTITVAGTAKAATNVLPYTDINVVIDVSTSMGIGATATDQTTLFKATGCALACHMSDSGNTDTLAAARATGALLRIDVVKSAVKKALQTINGLTVNNGQVRVAVYTLSNTLTKIYPLSNDIASAVNAIATIDMTQANNSGGTNTTYTLENLKTLLPTPGNGASSSSPRGFVVLMTDGVQNSAQEANYNAVTKLFTMSGDPNFVPLPSPAPSMTSWGIETIQAFDPAACTPIKAMGYTFMTMNVEYLIPAASLYAADTSGRFPFIENNLLSGITTNMQACATSKDLALSASSPTDIATAINTLFQKTLVTTPHLTQ